MRGGFGKRPGLKLGKTPGVTGRAMEKRVWGEKQRGPTTAPPGKEKRKCARGAGRKAVVGGTIGSPQPAPEQRTSATAVKWGEEVAHRNRTPGESHKNTKKKNQQRGRRGLNNQIGPERKSVQIKKKNR